MDDEFDLLRDPDGPDGSVPPERRPAWVLVGGLVAVVLLALVGVVWMVSSVSGRGGTVTAGATTSPQAVTAAPATTAATTTPAATTEPAPTTTVPRPTATTRIPVPPLPSAATVAPAPTPRPTPAPTTSRPVPPPVPVGKLVPDVVGLRVTVAARVLRGQGFKVRVLGGVLGPDRDDRRVIAQRPGAGAVARPGSTVILVTDGV